MNKEHQGRATPYDRQQQHHRNSEQVLLDDRPYRSVEPLGAEVIEAFAAIRRRRKLLRSEVYQQHHLHLLDLTYYLEHQPAATPPQSPNKDFIRVVSWNIKRGIHFDGIAAFLRTNALLQNADILMLNEVDIGMARSGNRHIAAELAAQLGFGFVYGNSYLCLDQGDARDKEQLDGGEKNRESMHGNAILSRFPFLRAENYSIEISKDKYHSSDRRLGHKKSLWAELDTPLGPLPVFSVHLDAYASAAQRGAQLTDVLNKVEQRSLGERVLLGGDLNTNTYDAGSIGQICLNVLKKIVRGGFAHAIHHYLHPYEIYERPVFDLLDAAGLDYHSFNARAVGTTRYEVGSYESESTVSEQLPSFAVNVLRRGLRPWNGVAYLKVDWFFGRGLSVCNKPGPIDRPMVDGIQLSDHDPIVLDIGTSST